MGHNRDSAKQPTGIYCGEVASMGNKFNLLQPREEEQQHMHDSGDAGCSRHPLQLSDVAGHNTHTPFMARCPEELQYPHVQTMQQVQDKTLATLADLIPHDTHQTNGSLIGSSILLTHSNESRLVSHTNSSRQPTPLNHTTLEQPTPSSPSLRTGDGEPRKTLEQTVSRTNSRRDSELCPHFSSFADSHELEPSDSNSEPASEARPTSPFQPLPQPPIPCPSPQVQPPLPHPGKVDTNFTGQAAEHSGELLQCRLPGYTACSHFSLPGSR